VPSFFCFISKLAHVIQFMLAPSAKLNVTDHKEHCEKIKRNGAVTGGSSFSKKL
jgi:hypothetical protein